MALEVDIVCQFPSRRVGCARDMSGPDYHFEGVSMLGGCNTTADGSDDVVSEVCSWKCKLGRAVARCVWSFDPAGKLQTHYGAIEACWLKPTCIGLSRVEVDAVCMQNEFWRQANITAIALAYGTLQELQEGLANETSELAAERNTSYYMRQELVRTTATLANVSAELAELREDYAEATGELAIVINVSNRTQHELIDATATLSLLRSHLAEVTSSLASLQESSEHTQQELTRALYRLENTRELLSVAWSELRYAEEVQLPEAEAKYTEAEEHAGMADEVLTALQGLHNAIFLVLVAVMHQLDVALAPLQGGGGHIAAIMAGSEDSEMKHQRALKHLRIAISALEQLVGVLPAGKLRQKALLELDLARDSNETAVSLAATVADTLAHLRELENSKQRSDGHDSMDIAGVRPQSPRALFFRTSVFCMTSFFEWHA